MNDTERRITELDGIRGLAALGVVVYHYHKHLGGAPFEAALFPVYRGGLLFVDLFFVLSGFILAQVYSYEARYPALRPAVVSRIARLYPLHLLTLCAVAALQKVHVLLTDHCFVYVYNDWRHLALNLFMLNESGLQRGFSFNGPSWSISTEFIVNVIFLAVALRNPKRALVLGLALVGGMIALNAAVGWVEPPHWFEPFSRLVRCFLSFGAGLVLRWIHERTRSMRVPGWIVEPVLSGTVVVMLYFMSRPERPAAYFALTLAVFPAMILLSLRSGVLGGLLRTRPIVHLGHISFSVYLLHYPLELLVTDVAALTGVRPLFDSPLALVAAVGGCIAASHVTWKYFEMPSRRGVKRALA